MSLKDVYESLKVGATVGGKALYQGANMAGQEVTKAALLAKDKMYGTNSADDYSVVANMQRQNFEKLFPERFQAYQQTTSGLTNTFLAMTPAILSGGAGLASKVGAAALGGALGNNLTASKTADNAEKMVGGAALGGALAAAIPVAQWGLNLGRAALGAKGPVVSDLAEAAKDTLSKLQPGLTPAEAMPNSVAVQAAQAQAMKTGLGNKLANDLYAGRDMKIGEQLTKALDKVAPGATEGDAAGHVQKALEAYKLNVLGAAAEKAKPLYEKSLATVVPEEVNAGISKLPNLGAYIKNLSADQKQLLVEAEEKFGQGSIGYYDAIKQALYDKAAVAKRAGEAKLATSINATRIGMVNMLDNLSPDYAQARAAIEEGHKALEAQFGSIATRVLGKSKDQLNNLFKTMFDAKEPNYRDIGDFKALMEHVDPEAYRAAIKTHVQNIVDGVKAPQGKVGTVAPNIYNALFKSERQMKILKTALGADSEAYDGLKALANTISQMKAPNFAGVGQPGMPNLVAHPLEAASYAINWLKTNAISKVYFDPEHRFVGQIRELIDLNQKGKMNQAKDLVAKVLPQWMAVTHDTPQYTKPGEGGGPAVPMGAFMAPGQPMAAPRQETAIPMSAFQ